MQGASGKSGAPFITASQRLCRLEAVICRSRRVWQWKLLSGFAAWKLLYAGAAGFGNGSFSAALPPGSCYMPKPQGSAMEDPQRLCHPEAALCIQAKKDRFLRSGLFYYIK